MTAGQELGPQTVLHSLGVLCPMGWKGGYGTRAALGPPWPWTMETDLSNDQSPLEGEPTGPISWVPLRWLDL